MPIEFPCPECDSYLRTDDNKAGLRIRCPACQAPVWVPHTEQWMNSYESSGTDEEISPAPFESNTSAPFENSLEVEDEEFEEDEEDEEIPEAAEFQEPIAQEISVPLIVRQSWQIYTQNFGPCLFVSMFDLFASVMVIMGVLILAFGTFRVLEATPELALLAALGILLVGWSVTFAALAVGNFRYFLAIVRGNSVSPRTLISAEANVGRMVIAGICYWSLVCFGLMFFVVPGLVVMIVLWPYGRLIVDQNCPANKSLTEAARMTFAHFEVSLAIFLFYIGVLLAAAWIPFVGQLLVLPFLSILHTVSYLHLSGEVVPQKSAASNF